MTDGNAQGNRLSRFRELRAFSHKRRRDYQGLSGPDEFLVGAGLQTILASLLVMVSYDLSPEWQIVFRAEPLMALLCCGVAGYVLAAILPVTVRRLRDANLPLWWCLAVYLPVLNVAFVALLADAKSNVAGGRR